MIAITYVLDALAQLLEVPMHVPCHRKGDNQRGGAGASAASGSRGVGAAARCRKQEVDSNSRQQVAGSRE